MAMNITQQHIEYTRGDTFRIIITPDTVLSSDTELRFLISKTETTIPLYDKKSTKNADGNFVFELSEEERNKLKDKHYIWKATLYYPDGDIETEISGTLSVKWGA